MRIELLATPDFLLCLEQYIAMELLNIKSSLTLNIPGQVLHNQGRGRLVLGLIVCWSIPPGCAGQVVGNGLSLIQVSTG